MDRLILAGGLSLLSAAVLAACVDDVGEPPGSPTSEWSVGRTMQGPPLPPSSLDPPEHQDRVTLATRPKLPPVVVEGAGPVVANPQPGRTLVLRLNDGAAARVEGAGQDARVLFGYAPDEVQAPRGEGEVYRLDIDVAIGRVAFRPPEGLRVELPTGSSGARNLAIGELASEGRGLVWRILAPTKEEDGKLVFVVAGVRDAYFQLTSSDPPG